ncbi:MAG: hypothetical protein R2762_24900 [Bryobacteraceae bacterium]
MTFDLSKIAAIHTAYLCLVGAMIWGWLRWVGAEITPLTFFVCGLPAVLSLMLAFTSMEDEQQYVVRLMACAMFTPLLLLMWGIGADAPALPRMPWAYGVGAGLLHIAVFVGSVLWIGTATTVVQAEAGVAPVDVGTLRGRLLSLNRIGGPLSVSEAASDALEMTVIFRFRSPGRSYRVLLNLDPSEHRVRVRERASAAGSAPETEAEKSMRGIGDPSFDPTRPNASKVSETTAQVTPVKRQALAAMPLTLSGSAAAVPPDVAASLDPEAMLTLLCAVTTRSGWHWQPAFFGAF